MRDGENKIITALRSDFVVGGILGDIGIDGIKGLTSLRSEPGDLDAKAKRYELIDQIRGGKHAQLTITARTFKQQPGVSNANFLRLGGDLDPQARTFASQPFLMDHNTYNHTYRKGTILRSQLVDETKTRVAFEQTIEVVKPEAAISVLDGTLDRFSIGWRPLGPVLCTAHGCDVLSRDSCECWPGDKVMVDGKPKIAEYEFSAWEGKETSGVSIPAVKGTSINDVRAALAAELQLPPRTRTRPKENQTMKFARLAAALGLAALEDGDEDRALAAVESLRQRAVAADGVRAELVQAQTALRAATGAVLDQRVNALIERAYDDGRLRRGRDENGNPAPSLRETRLRRIARDGGIAELEAELAEMEPTIRLGGRAASLGVGEPARVPVGSFAPQDNPYLNDVAEQLGIKVEDMERYASGHLALDGGR